MTELGHLNNSLGKPFASPHLPKYPCQQRQKNARIIDMIAPKEIWATIISAKQEK